MDQQECIRRLQGEELDVLLAVADFCERNDITWFMMSGTALGALRHRGFIPWDDDIDIGMLRDDYDRFLELAAGGLPEGYSLHTHENTSELATFFAKVCRAGTVFQTAETAEAGFEQGIFVDVFPFDRVPDDPEALRALKTAAARWQRTSYLYHSGTITVPDSGMKGALERLACRVAHHVVRLVYTREKIAERFGTLIDRAPVSPVARVRYLALSWPYVDPIDRDVLVPPVRASFEGYELPVPAQPDRYLEQWYGNWRQLPPEDKRRTHLPERIVFSDGSEWRC